MTPWEYNGTADADRVRALQVSVHFEELISRVAREMNILCCHTKDCDDRAGYKRTICSVRISSGLFDLFFNSSSGYRGAYFASPERGFAMNTLLLAAVRPHLVNWIESHYYAVQDAEFAAASLLAPSAKAWLAEETLSLCAKCRGEWSASTRADLTIVNGRWENDSQTHAEWGRQAHRFEKLRFFGAFINDCGEEWVANHKQKRAEDIYARGWS